MKATEILYVHLAQVTTGLRIINKLVTQKFPCLLNDRLGSHSYIFKKGRQSILE